MLKSLLLILVCVFIGVSGQLILKVAMNSFGRIDSSAIANPLALIGRLAVNPVIILAILLYIAGALLWMVVLSRENLSFAYPILATSYIFVVILSKFIFNEPVGFARIIGAITIFAGVILITRS